jgi:chemotaxis protein CheD
VLDKIKHMPAPSHLQQALALPGFEHIRRGWIDAYEAWSARLQPGEYYVTKSDEAIYTTLGSCVSACIRDRFSGIGGMNHLMLPQPADDELSSWKSRPHIETTRYGNFAMEHLINTILKHGGLKQNLEIKLFGGGRIMANMTDIGMRNIDFVHDYLKTHGLQSVSEDLGDVYPRMVVYFPATGKVRVKRLRSLHTNTIAAQEVRYLASIQDSPVSGFMKLP